MNRRTFGTIVGTAAAGVVLGRTGAPLLRNARADECAGPPLGVQLFTVRDALQRDPRATLVALRDLGIVEAELYGLSGDSTQVLGFEAVELKNAFIDAGVRVEFAHIDGSLTKPTEIAVTAHALGVSTLVIALPDEFTATRDGRFTMIPPTSRVQLDALALRLDRMGRELRDRGLAFAYHNHWVEFMPVEGVVPYDYLLSRTDPALVKLELDVGWVAAAGADPVAYLRKYAGRVVACHLKDFDPTISGDALERKLLPPGAGRIDFRAVLAAMSDANVAHGFVEVDAADDPLDAVSSGSRHLQALRGCA